MSRSFCLSTSKATVQIIFLFRSGLLCCFKTYHTQSIASLLCEVVKVDEACV